MFRGDSVEMWLANDVRNSYSFANQTRLAMARKVAREYNRKCNKISTNGRAEWINVRLNRISNTKKTA